MQFIRILLLVSFLFCVAHSASQKVHVKCVQKVFHMLNELCGHVGDLEILKAKAVECCENNCTFAEMVATCISSDTIPSQESNL